MTEVMGSFDQNSSMFNGLYIFFFAVAFIYCKVVHFWLNWKCTYWGNFKHDDRTADSGFLKIQKLSFTVFVIL